MIIIKPKLDMSIMVVDDDALVRNILVEYLISFGFKNVLQAKNVPQAIKYVQDPKCKIDLIMSDWEMPGAKGLELLKAIRKNPTRKLIPFIMVTSQESIERFKITQAAQWRVTDYMIKPFTSEVLKDRIWKVMGWSLDEAV
jgi:two-component system chemotaxis response regulator CheY